MTESYLTPIAKEDIRNMLGITDGGGGGGSSDGGVVIAKFTSAPGSSSIECDKTFTEISTAISDGKFVFGYRGGVMYMCNGIGSSASGACVQFSRVWAVLTQPSETSISSVASGYIILYSDNTVKEFTQNLKKDY